jgi:hypothetical protein
VTKGGVYENGMPMGLSVERRGNDHAAFEQKKKWRAMITSLYHLRFTRTARRCSLTLSCRSTIVSSSPLDPT